MSWQRKGFLKLTYEENESLHKAVDCYYFFCLNTDNIEEQYFIEGVKEKLIKKIKLRK